eukprot:6186831-Pleurochrysis_carterae.AAC.6
MACEYHNCARSSDEFMCEKTTPTDSRRAKLLVIYTLRTGDCLFEQLTPASKCANLWQYRNNNSTSEGAFSSRQ